MTLVCLRHLCLLYFSLSTLLGSFMLWFRPLDKLTSKVKSECEYYFMGVRHYCKLPTQCLASILSPTFNSSRSISWVMTNEQSVSGAMDQTSTDKMQQNPQNKRSKIGIRSKDCMSERHECLLQVVVINIKCCSGDHLQVCLDEELPDFEVSFWTFL